MKPIALKDPRKSRSLRSNKLSFLLVWILLTGVILILVLYPIYIVAPHFPFWKLNSLFIIVLMLLLRYTFFLKYTYLARVQWLKIVLFFLCIPLVFNLVYNLNYFLSYADDKTFDPLFNHLTSEKKLSMEKYIRSEIMLFGVGSIVISIYFAFRMLISVWRQRNTHGV